MSKWKFAVTFRPTENLKFSFAETEIEIAGVGKLLLRVSDNRLSGLDDERFGKPEIFGDGGTLAVIMGPAQPTIQEAYRLGHAIQIGLLAFGVRHGVRVDPGLRELLYPPETQNQLEVFAKNRRRGPGLDLYRGERSVAYEFGQNSWHYPMDDTRCERLAEEIAHFVQNGSSVSTAAVRAASTLSENMWWVASVSAIECLSPAEKVGEDQAAVIDELAAFVANCSLEDQSKDQLRNRVLQLKHRSISASCRDFVDTALSQQTKDDLKRDFERTPRKLFSDLYRIRSRQVHSGIVPSYHVSSLEEYDEMQTLSHVLHETLVPELLHNELRASAVGANTEGVE